MGRRNIITIAIAVLLGLLAVYIANAWFRGVEQREQQLTQEAGGIVRIAVARQPMEFGTRINQENTRLIDWPESSVPTGAFMELDEIASGTRVALRPIAVGEPILASKVSGLNGRAIISANIPEDMRAYSIPVSELTGVSGFVMPGDVVDIFLTRSIPGEGAGNSDKMTSVLLENIQVVAVNQQANDTASKPLVGQVATVLVDQYNAQKLALAQQLGTLSLALRNVENQVVGATGVVTAADLGGGGLYIPDRSPPPVYAGPAPSAPAPAPAAAPARTASRPARPSGPTMTIVRGTQGSDYEVQRYGSR